MLGLVLTAVLAQPAQELWEQALLPPEGGRIEVRAGPSMHLAFGDAPQVTPDLVLGFRIGVTRRLSFGAPLYASFLLVEGDHLSLAVSGGIPVQGLGVTAADGLINAATLHLELFARGGGTVARLRAGAVAVDTTADPLHPFFFLELEGSLLRRLSDRIAAGVSLEARWWFRPKGAPRPYFAAGAWGWPYVGPTVRVTLEKSWAVDAAVRWSWPSLLVGAALVWSPKIF